MPRKYTPKGPSVKRRYLCFGCGHWHFGTSHIKERPLAYIDVEYAGKGKIKVLRRAYVDELGRDHEHLLNLREHVERLCRYVDLVLEGESKLRAELARRARQVAELRDALENLTDAAKEEQHRPPARASARPGARRTDNLYGTHASARPGTRRTDGVVAQQQQQPIITDFVEYAHRAPKQARAKAGARRTDSL